MTEEIGLTVGQLQALVKETSKEGLAASAVEDLAEKLLNILPSLPALDFHKKDHKLAQPQIESCAVSLWNVAVARKASGNLSSSLNARLRHISCSLVFLCATRDADETAHQKQTVMAIKTARAWLDDNNPSMADSPLSMASDCLEKLHTLVTQQLTGGGDADMEAMEKKKLEIDQDLFKVLCYKAESACAQGQQETAMELTMRAKEFLHKIPKERMFLSMLCYNFGVECFQQQKFDASVSWLRESYELGKGKNAVGPQNQARTLRLLANAYLEWDGTQHLQKALNAIGLANAEHAHAAGHYLKVRILLLGEAADDRLQSALDDVLHHAELTMDLGIAIAKLVSQHERYEVALEGLKQLSLQFSNSPDSGQIWLTRLELLLQCQKLDQAKELIEECVISHNTGNALEESSKNRFHLLMWEQAAQAFEKKDFANALQWYNYSLSLFSASEQTNKNAAKLHRNRSACHIGLDQLDKAQDAIRQAEKCDPTSPHTYYYIFKISLKKGEDDKAMTALQAMSDHANKNSDESTIQGLICLAAQLAFEGSNRLVAVKALESLANHSTSIQQVLTALRCLIRLKLTLHETEGAREKIDMASVVSYITKAHGKLSGLLDRQNVGTVNVSDEASWFMKMAWNMALQCEGAYKEMHELFCLCCKLTSMSQADMAGLMRQKTCLMMASAASLQLAKTTSDDLDKRLALQQTLEHIDECRNICGKILQGQISSTDAPSRDNTTPVLLILYEFEARANLGDPDLEKVLEKALALPHAEAKAFETIAALAMEAPANNRGVSTRALKVAIKKHLQQDPTDFNRCSKAFHSLVDLSMMNGSSTDPASWEEAWGYYMDAMDVIENRAKGTYPEMEALWLMTKAWNCGIHLYSATKYNDAAQWCELGMKLLQHLGSLKKNYEGKMTNVYGEILAKLDAHKKPNYNL